jgi:hypothetical protein
VSHGLAKATLAHRGPRWPNYAGVRRPANVARHLVPRTRSSHHNCHESDCELRVQSGTRIIDLLVSYDFRSSLPSKPQTAANFGIGTLAGEDAIGHEIPGV